MLFALIFVFTHMQYLTIFKIESSQDRDFMGTIDTKRTFLAAIFVYMFLTVHVSLSLIFFLIMWNV